MRKQSKILFRKSIDSLILSIEHFNRPWDCGRVEACLILLDRAFELLLKAIIIHRGGRIREPRAKETIGFEKSLRICVTQDPIRCLSEEEALTIQIINSLRDAAQHYLVDVSEQQLYLYTQAGVTLYTELIEKVFQSKLYDYLPERVLPVSTSPPQDLHVLVASEFQTIKDLVKPGARKNIQAREKLRSLAIVEASLGGVRSQPSESELGKMLKEVRTGKTWKEVFPGIASLQLSSEGTGLSFSVKLTKNEGEPVRLVPEGTPGATLVAIKRVNELGFYSLGLKDLASKLGLGTGKTLALVRHFKMQEREDHFKEIVVGKTCHKRYSMNALDFLKKELPKLDMTEIWERNRPKSIRKRV